MENIDVSNALKITPSKSEDLIQARIDKIERLSAISRKIAAGTADYIANQAKTAEAKSNSAVGILSNVTGIDFTPEKSIIGTGLNTAVGLGSGLSRLSGQVASGIHDANALLLNKDIPQEVKDARARQLQGQATPEDEKLLALPRGDLTERKVAPNDFMHRVRKDFKSNLSQIQDMEESLKNAQSLREAFDFSSAVHQGTKDALTDDLKHTTVEDLNQVSEGWDALKQGKVIAGLKDMASGIAGSTPKIADAAIKHPLGTAQFLAENLPNTLAAATGAAGMVASNAAYALDTMGQGMTERTKALKGAMPTNEDLAWNALWSSTAGLAETYGDKLMGIPKLFKGAPKEVVEAAKDMNKGSFIKSILNSGPVKTTAAIAEGAAGEYVTEGYQTWAENAAKVKETSLEEAFTGAAIGAITGGVMSGGIHGVAELAGSTPEKIKAKEDVVATQVAHGTAILNNDTTAYLDPTTPQYSPTKALEVLYAHAKLDTTTPEVKSTNLNKADDVVAMAEQDLKNVLEASDVAKRSPEQLEAAKGELQQLKSLIESTNPDDKSRLTALNQEISYLERGLQASVSKIAAKQLTAEIKSRTTELNTARTLQEQLTTVVSRKVSPESVSKDIEVAALPLNVADQPAVESSQQAIGRLIKLSMANTQAITHEAATMLANDTANTLTDPQRLYLREFSAARIAQNKLQTTESVGATILSGDGLNLGLKQYQQYIGRALEAGNTKVASNYIAMLENFVDSHEQKAILATAAMEKAKDTNRSIKILKSKDGRWGYAPAGVEITREMIEKNGGLVLHPNSLRSNALAKAVPVEAEALKQALVAHKAAFALTFNQPVTSVTPAAQTSATPSSAASVPSAVPPSPVPTTKESNVTQTLEAKQSQPQASSTSSGSTTTEAPLPSVADSPKAASVGEAVAPGAAVVGGATQTNTTTSRFKIEYTDINEPLEVEVVTDDAAGTTHIQAYKDSEAYGPYRDVTNLRKDHPTDEGLADAVWGGDREGNHGAELISKTVKPVAQTTAAPTSVAPVDSAENVREYTDAITNVSTELTKNATTATSTVIDADLISENTDVAILLEMLGVTTNNGRYTVTPSAKDILTAQARIVDVYTSVLAGTTKIADHTAELGKLLSWFKTDATTQDNPERKARAEKGAAKYGNGNPEAHLLIQLAEEMGELLSEVNRLTGQKDLSEATLEVQKRAFKVLRFGATTSNKDQKSIYFGKTNAEAYQQAVESAASPLKETVSVEKTAEVESRSEQAPESEEKTAKPIAAGTLSLFSQFKEKLEGTVSEAYKSTNLAAQYLKQSGLVSGATSQRALVAVKDFMSTWRDSTNKRDFLKEHLGMQPDQSFTTNEWAALKNFAVTVSGWLPVIQANLFKYDVLTQEEIKAGKKARNKHGGKSEYKMLDMLQYFYLDDKFADVEENVKTAIAASAYSYVVDRAMSPARMTDEDINTMHGKKEHESIQSYEGMKLLQTMASFEETAITQLGKAAVQALGIKPRDENTPMDILPRLENALGTQALELLKKQGFVKTSEHPLMTINGYWDTSSDEKLIENALKYTNHPGESVSLGSTMSMQNVRDMFKVAKGAKSVGPKQLATQARLRATSPSAFTVASKLYNPLKTLRYVSFVYKKDKEKTYKRELTEQVSVIKEASLGSKSVINKLFGIEKAPRIASTKPANFNQESPKDTNQAIPKLHQKVMQATQQIPHTLVPAMWQVSLGMGKDAILEIAGKVDVNVEDPNFQINNLPSVLAQNDNLENQFDLAFEQITQEGEEASWFVTGSIWSNLRNGYKEMSMNLQSSKIHRYLFTRPAWTVTLKFDDKPMVDEFLISLAMAMGTKTDQKRNEITLEDVFTEQTEDTPAQFHNPDIMEAAYIIQLGLQQGESGEVWTQANIDKVVSVTVGEGMMSLQALTAYANYLTAFDNKLENPDKVKDFSFTLLVGADGKTNGPMLTLLALGAADYQTLNRGGMFSDQEGSTATHFSEYYGEAQARDLYQQLGLDSVTDTMGKMATEEDILNWQADRYERHDTKYRMTAEELREQPFLPEQFQALEAIVGSLQLKAGLVVSALRNLVKKPITAFFFGSSVNNAVKGMENEFIQSIYDHIQGIKQGTKKTDITDLLSNINALIEMSDGPVLTISTLEEAMQLEFTMPQRASLQKSFVVLLGNSVKKKLESTFSTLIARRDVFNKTVQASYEIHAAAVANARINKINELMDQGKLAYRSTTVDGKEVRVPLRDLTKAEYDFVKRSLEHLQPVMHNAFSLEEDYLPAGIYMADSYVDKSTEPMYENAVKFPGNGGPDFKIHSESQLRKEKTPGLRGLPFSIHSSDSFGMQSALAAEPKAEALNVHDEISTGVANIAGSAMAINAATVNTFLHFSPAREALNMLERLVTRMATHVGQDKANPQTVRSMLSNWLDVYNHGLAKEDRIKFDEVADKTLRNAAANAYQVDIDRLTLISKMAYMDQYTWEGGQFKVTQEIRDEAVKQLEALKALKDGYLPSKEAQEAIRYLNTVAHAANKKDAVLPSWFEKTVDEVEEVDLPVKPNTWGVLGSNSLSESSVLSWFDKSDVLSAREVMDALVTEYKKTPKQASSKFALMLLEQLRKVVSPKLVVRMIRPDTAKSDVIGADTGTFDNVLGEYRLDGTEQAIYVMGPEFKNSGVTAELLLHELLHAALSWVLYDVKNGTGTAAANILYKSLDSLRQRAIERANKTKDLKHFAKILEGESGVDELISWGLSNQEFQTKVLRNVTMAIALPSQTQGIVSMNGMQAFLQAIRKFFFRATKVEPVTETGLAVLLANVSGLFAEANTAEQKTARNINLSMAAQINTFSTLDIHEALDTGEVSDAFNDHLRNVLTNIVEKLHGSFGSFKESIMKSVPHSAIDAWALAQANGETPFVSDLQASGFQFNNQTYFVAEQVEATVKSILDSKDGKLSSVREELRKLEAEVRGKLTVQSFYQGPDWATATPQEQAEAQQLYDYLFKKVDDDYLARFAALGLSHEGFNALLKMPTKQAPVILKDRTVGNTLMNLFDRVLVALNGKLTHTKAGQAADVKLAALVRQLVEIENRKKAVLNQVSTGILAFADKKVRASRRGTKNQISKLVNSTMFKRNKNVTIAAVSHVVDAVMGNRVKYLVQNMNKMRNDVFPGAQGAIASALAEMNGNSHDLQKVLREGKAHLEGARKKIISYANKQALESFVDGGVYLADEAKSAVTNVLLRTGAHVLLGKYDMKQIADLVNNKATLLKEIASYEAQLSKFTPAQREIFLYQSKALGYHLAGYGEKSASLMKNASNIANLYTSAYQGQLNEADTLEATKTIDVLTTLYALQYSRSADIAALASVFTTENSRTDGDNNGLRMVLLMQQSSERESLARLFNDDPVQMAKGYIPEIYNPHTDLKAATKDEGEILENLGYKKVSDLGLDPHDVYREGHALYVMRDGGLRPWLSGMFSFTNMRAKGTKHHGERAVGTQNGLDRARQRAINDMALPGAGQNFDPTQVKENYMVPVLNPMGKAVNHQYLMQASTKDRLLERDSRFDTVLGALAGSVFDKDNSPKHNRKVVEVLHADFEKEFAKDAKAFRTVGPSSPDPELREIYAMLPQSTKDAIKDVWGSDSMLVHVGNLDIAFGYRKLSMSTMFSKDAAERDAIDKAAVFLLENILKHYAKVFLHYDDAEAEKYSKRTAVTVQRAENIWQAVVHEVKDIYVIKNIITSLNNIRSNMLTLFLYGVTPMNGLRDMRIAWVGAEEHHRDSEQLFKLQNLLSTGYVTGDTSHIQSEIDRLNIAIKNNPVTEMINAGLMPTIVEDVANEDDPYSYKSAFIKSTEKYTSKLNSSVRSAGKVAYMSHDTKVYQSLARITQLSDFVARYALYQQLTTRKENPVSKEVAIQEASDAFINYDVPMNRNLQYMDDMGFFMFTKYFLRIQRVIRGRFIHSSGKMALMLGAESYLGSMPTIMDASVLVRAGNNPLGMGALQFPSAIGEIAPIAATRAMAHGLFNM